jgi:hypothetical protein
VYDPPPLAVTTWRAWLRIFDRSVSFSLLYLAEGAQVASMHNQHIDHVLALHKEFLNGFLINPADLAVGV